MAGTRPASVARQTVASLRHGDYDLFMPLAAWMLYDSPLGPLTVIEAEEGPLAVSFSDQPQPTEWPDTLQRRLGAIHLQAGRCPRAVGWLDAYFAGSKQPIPYPEHLSRYLEVSPAEEVVWRSLLTIPFGATASYRALGARAGLHPRAVGRLTGANPLAVLIPCHRIVGSDGRLVGYGGGLGRKRWLLDHEIRFGDGLLRPQEWDHGVLTKP